MTCICTVCVRGGSKGVKNKNIRELVGKPLLAYTLGQAKACELFDLIAVSSDSREILEVGRRWGADLLVVRPPELATDTAAKLPVIRHCVQEAELVTGKQFDIVVDLDATSPLRLPEDIRGAVNLMEIEKASNVITVAPARRSPYFNLVELDDDGVVRLSKPPVEPIVRRQDSPQCFDMNASIYVWKRSALFDSPTLFNPDTRLFIMPPERSVDIDTEFDFEVVELLMRKRIAE
ncbi:MAG: acylneuraminate cytidylyltransferase family protein [Chloroflexi bacterium]|nr:acylneuraminate cytidylyltransferase family protein [Chloroflexota bacterium]